MCFSFPKEQCFESFWSLKIEVNILPKVTGKGVPHPPSAAPKIILPPHSAPILPSHTEPREGRRCKRRQSTRRATWSTASRWRSIWEEKRTDRSPLSTLKSVLIYESEIQYLRLWWHHNSETPGDSESIYVSDLISTSRLPWQVGHWVLDLLGDEVELVPPVVGEASVKRQICYWSWAERSQLW